MAQKVIVKQEQELNARIERRKSMSNRSTTSENNDFDETSTSKFTSKEHMNVGMILSGIKQRNVKRVFI
jgi:TPP-dependent indolepyruvate ferredoxin oxidoreductase alpha subunit